MTFNQKMLSITLSGILISFLITASAAIALYHINSSSTQKHTTASSTELTTELGLALIQTTRQALTPLVTTKNVNGVQAIIATAVASNPHINYGAYLDEDLVPWALATPSAPHGIPQSQDSLTDENSLWGSELQQGRHISTQLNGVPTTLFASPIFINDEYRGTAYFGVNETPATTSAYIPQKLFTIMSLLLAAIVAILVLYTILSSLISRQFFGPVQNVELSIKSALRSGTLGAIKNEASTHPLTATFNQFAQNWTRKTIEQQALTQATINIAAATTPSAASMAVAKALFDCTRAQLIALTIKHVGNQQQIYVLEGGECKDQEPPEDNVQTNPELAALIERALNTYTQNNESLVFTTADVLCRQQVRVTTLATHPKSEEFCGHIFIIDEVDLQCDTEATQPSDFLSLQLGQLLTAALARINETDRHKEQVVKLSQNCEHLTQRLDGRDNDLANIMRNLHEGMLIITEDGTIDHHYSQKLETLLSAKAIAGEHYKDLLFSNSGLPAAEINQMTCAIDTTLGSQELMYDFNSHLLCEELNIIDPNGNNKTLHTHWDPIIDKGIITKLMLTLSDTTRQGALERTTRAQKEELELVGQVLKVNAQKFDELMHYTQVTLNRNIKLIRDYEKSDALDFNALFRNIHNIKKEARTQGLTHLTDSLHNIEVRYDEIRQNITPQWRVSDLLSDIQIITTKIERYKHINNDILKRTDHTAAPQLSKEQLYTIASELKNLKPTISGNSALSSLAIIENMLLDATTLDIANLATKRLTALASIAEPLGKVKPSIHIHNNRYRIHNKLKSDITEVLDQILRNSIYHSLEEVEERKNQGKNVEGEITLTLNERAGNLIINVTDDGKGLNMKRLAEKGINKNQISPTETKNLTSVAQLLFNKAVYTQDSPSIDSSYRYGIAHIKDALLDFGGNASVTVLSACENSYCKIAIELSLPANLYTKIPEQPNPHPAPIARAQ